MLRELTVQNFALIEHLHMEFSEGLNVLSGETGAGKSIIIDAVGLLLGERASQTYIRGGTDKATVSGLFQVTGLPAAGQLLAEMGLPGDDEGNLLLSREITANGKNTCRVNGQVVTLTMYQQFGRLLVDIHGQHDHQSLLSPGTQRQLLDGFCGPEMVGLLDQIKEIYHRWQKVRQNLEDLDKRARDLDREEDYYRFQLDEIDKAQLSTGEEEELAREKQRLEGAGVLASGSEKVRSLLYDAGAGNLSAYDAISRALAELNIMLKYDDSLAPLAENLEQALYQVEECSGEIRRYAETLTFDPRRLDQVENRLQLIKQLKRKYGSTVAEIIAYRERIAASLEELTEKTENREALQKEVAALEREYLRLAGKITNLRRQGGRRLVRRLLGLWEELAMSSTRFQVQVSESEPQPQGKDTVRFLISPNPGEELKPLAKIASGGEMSRVMLALKTVLAEIDRVPTLIFDEIDAGIGGETVVRIAEKLAAIGSHRQVLCVTHSARIAAKAGKHFAVCKEVINGRTLTSVKPLSKEQRIEELARMLGSTDKAALVHAKTLLNA